MTTDSARVIVSRARPATVTIVGYVMALLAGVGLVLVEQAADHAAVRAERAQEAADAAAARAAELSAMVLRNVAEIAQLSRDLAVERARREALERQVREMGATPVTVTRWMVVEGQADRRRRLDPPRPTPRPQPLPPPLRPSPSPTPSASPSCALPFCAERGGLPSAVPTLLPSPTPEVSPSPDPTVEPSATLDPWPTTTPSSPPATSGPDEPDPSG